MKISISEMHLKEKPDDGISRFTFEVIKRLILKNPLYEFILIFDREYSNSLLFGENCTGIILKPATRHPFLWFYWHEVKLPKLLKKIQPDLFLSPDGIISLRIELPQIAVIHDISFFHRPADTPILTSLYYRHFYKKFALHASHIITVSEFCKKDISSYLGINPNKIDVALNGVSEYFYPASEDEKNNLRMMLTGGLPYFVFVGNFSPRKNIPSLIKAWHLFRQKTGMNHRLVLAGGRLFLNRETDRMICLSPWRDDIILPGLIPHQNLRLLYSSADALVFVPWFEGFGIPAAEAMRCGTPVILSSATSLPEIGGNAALYASPDNPDEICNAMIKIASDLELRKTLSVAGQIQSHKFTWDKTVECIGKVLEKVFQNKNLPQC
ncbi:MAG: glycosyltransferase family 4 protein [Bacteroidales bacterium]